MWIKKDNVLIETDDVCFIRLESCTNIKFKDKDGNELANINNDTPQLAKIAYSLIYKALENNQALCDISNKAIEKEIKQQAQRKIEIARLKEEIKEQDDLVNEQIDKLECAIGPKMTLFFTNTAQREMKHLRILSDKLSQLEQL